MQKIKDVLRLHLLGGVGSCRQLARAVGCGKSAVADCLRRAKVANLGDWAIVAELDEAELSRRLYPAAGATPSRQSARPLPDWTKVREELARADHQMTLALLWEEYKGQHPDGYQYSQFAELYRRFEKRLSVVLRQPHRAGEKCFVDFCDGLPLFDEHTGERISTELFVGALGASSYTFARATLSQDLPTWLDCHVRMYEFFSGASAITVPDNLRSAIKTPDRYEAEINPAYLLCVPERLARARRLLSLGELHGRETPNGVELTIYQKEVARFLGLPRQAVNQYLQNWREQRWVNLGRGQNLLLTREANAPGRLGS